jgi:hypothetical protein
LYYLRTVQISSLSSKGVVAQLRSSCLTIVLSCMAMMLAGLHGFALDEDEDDVYGDAVVEYDTAVDSSTATAAITLLNSNSNTASSLSAAAAAYTAAATAELQAHSTTVAQRRTVRCPSDNRLPPAGFLVAVKPDVLQKHWTVDSPPDAFIPRHVFSAAEDTQLAAMRQQVWGAAAVNRGRVTTGVRGALLGEAKPPGQRPPNGSAGESCCLCKCSQQCCDAVACIY